jgi:putative flippase GtrA
MSVGRQLPRFALAGTAGFVVDAAVLYAALAAGLGYFSGRAVSFFVAVVTTWLINRAWTFEARRTRATVAEFARYFAAMALGGAVNYATYTVVVSLLPRAAWLPLAAVAAGSIAGLGVNFATAWLWVFRRFSATERRGVNDPIDEGRWLPAAFWTALAAGVLALKLFALMLDPQPQFFMGDSASYVHTALTGWVPPDRSYLYGVLIRIIAADTQSLAPLVLAQVSLSAATALLAAWWAELVFRPGRAILCVVAFVCALDPSPLLYERYVMTEAFSLFALAAMIVALTTLIVRGRWLWVLPAAAAGTLVVGLRASLMPVVVCCLLVGPLLALLVRTLDLRRTLLGLGIAAVSVPVLGSLVARIETGPFLLSAWSPLLTPQDFPDPEQGARVLRGIDVGNPELFAREVNLWHPTGLMQRLSEEVAEPRARHRLARETAKRVLLRDPMGVAGLGWRTYARLWDAETRLRLMRWDVGQNPLGPKFRETLAASFRLVADDVPRPSWTSRYYPNLRSSALLSCTLRG